MARDNLPQPGLFGPPPAAPRRAPVGPAEPSEEWIRVAGALPPNVRLGTSSWSFPGWAGLVYDRTVSTATLARHGLAAYARHPLLRAAGIDRTFYAPIAASTFAEYATAVPDDFRFLVKASGECTSPEARDEDGRAAGPNPRFLDPSWAADLVVAPFVEGLGAKAGPLVFQFPPLPPEHVREPERFAETLGRFLAALPAGPWYAVELRDAALLGEPYFAALDGAGARHCFSRHPRMPPIAEQLRAAGPRRGGPVVVRWMLHPGLGYEQALRRYEPFTKLVDEDPETRETLAALCTDPDLGIRPIVIIANNKAEGSAPLTVFELARSIASLQTT